MSFDYVSSFNFREKSIFYKELKLKHLKTIYKSLIGDTPVPSSVILNLNSILIELTNDKQFVSTLNYIEYLTLLFEIRCNSIGNLIFAELTKKEDTKLEINIYKFIEVINDINFNQLLSSSDIDDVQIFYKLPTITDLILFENVKSIDQVYIFFIDSIKVKDMIINFNHNSIEEKINFFDNLPAKVTSCVFKKIFYILKELSKVNLLSTSLNLPDITLPLTCNPQNICAIIKLLFGDQLMSIYDNIFALCKGGNFTPEYLENCTPGEYLLYVKKLEAILKQQNRNPSQELPDFDPMLQ